MGIIKKIAGALACAVLTQTAVAQDVTFSIPNGGGGEIVITARPCIVDGENYVALREAYSHSPGAPVLRGCWGMMDGDVHINWINPDGTTDHRVYAVRNFRPKSGGSAK